MRVRTNEHTIKKVRNLVNTFDQLGKKLPAFTSKTKRPASSDGSQPGPSVYLISASSIRNDQTGCKARPRQIERIEHPQVSSPWSLHVISLIDSLYNSNYWGVAHPTTATLYLRSRTHEQSWRSWSRSARLRPHQGAVFSSSTLMAASK